MATLADFLTASDRQENLLVEMEPALELGAFTLTASQTFTFEVAFLSIPTGEVIDGGMFRTVTRVRENEALLTSKWVEVQVGATRSYAIWAVTA